jgi:hypothetical protein
VPPHVVASHLVKHVAKHVAEIIRGKDVTLTLENHTGHDLIFACQIGYDDLALSQGWIRLRRGGSSDLDFKINPDIPMPVIIYAKTNYDRQTPETPFLEWGGRYGFHVMWDDSFEIWQKPEGYQVAKGDGHVDVASGYLIFVRESTVSVLTPQ